MPAEQTAAPRPAGLPLFSEMLLVGVLITALSLPLVTVLPALTAGVRHLDRHATSKSDTLGLLVHDLQMLLRGAWPLALGLPAAIALLVLNLDILDATTIPGGNLLRWVTTGIAAALVVLALRTIGARALDPTAPTWPGALRRAQERVVADPTGDALLLAAVVMAAAVAWMLPALVILAPGLLTFAILAVERRAGTRDHSSTSEDLGQRRTT